MGKRFDHWDERISDIVRADRDLRRADLVLRQRVATARRAGRSWAAIGLAMGISRQAAQQRFGPDARI